MTRSWVRGSRRARNIWWTVWLTLGGICLLGAATVWLERSRSTDRQDPAAGVTAAFLHERSLTAPPLAFADAAEQLGIAMRHGPGPRGRTLPEDTGSGLAWGDYDGDGDWDLYLVNFPGPWGSPPDPAATNRLFRNDGGRFVDVTASAGVGDAEGYGMGASFADYDDDGWVDLYVTNFGPNRLFRNRGDGTFEEVAATAGVDDALWSTGAVWGDFDRDGHLDLYVVNYVRYDDGGVGPEIVMQMASGSYGVPFTLNPNSFDPQPNRLYRNRGDGTFEDVAEIVGVSNPEGRGLNALFCDLDGDGWHDLYVGNDVSENKMFRNLGTTDGSLPLFADVSAVTGTADPRASMGMSVAELGWMSDAADDLPDIFLTHWVAQENALYQSTRIRGGVLEYRDKTRAFGLGELSLDKVGWGSALVDLDRDGRLDLVVVNGSTLERQDDPSRLLAEPMFVYWNNGRAFQDVAAAAGAATRSPHGARGLAAADYDADGDIDLAVSVNRGSPLLLRNDTRTENQSLTVALRGPSAACFGARVTLVTDRGRDVRWWGADVSFLGMHAPDLVFGLGKSPVAAALEVVWADGAVTERRALPAGRAVISHPSALAPDNASLPQNIVPAHDP